MLRVAKASRRLPLVPHAIEYQSVSLTAQADVAAVLIEGSDYLSSEWWAPADLRKVLADLSEPLEVWACERAIGPLLKVASRGFSELAVRKLQERAAIAGDLDPVLMDGDQLLDGRHRVQAYARAGRATMPTVDIGPLLRTDWEKWMNG